MLNSRVIIQSTLALLLGLFATATVTADSAVFSPPDITTAPLSGPLTLTPGQSFHLTVQDPDSPLSSPTGSVEVAGVDPANSPFVLDGTDLIFQETTDPSHFGTFEVTVTFTDETKLSDSFELTIRTVPGQDDPLPPLVKIESPRGSTAIGSTFRVTGTVREEFALRSLTVTVNDRIVLDLEAPVIPASHLLSWTTATLPARIGINTIVVKATDLNGQTGIAIRDVRRFSEETASMAGRYETLLERFSDEQEGLIGPKNTGVDLLNYFGLVTLNVNSRGSFSGRALIAGVSVPLTGFISNDGVALFSNNANQSGFPISVLEGTHVIDIGLLTLRIQGQNLIANILVDGEVLFAAGTGAKCPFSSENPVSQKLLFRAGKRGHYTLGTYSIAFDQTIGLGHGYVRLVLSRTGSFSATGFLADNTPCTFAGRLRSDLTIAMFQQLYGYQGAFGGNLAFANLPNTDVSGLRMTWIRPQIDNSGFNAWQTERFGAFGTRYRPGSSYNFGQVSNGTDGNSLLLIGNVVNQLFFSTNSPVVARIPAFRDDYSLLFNGSTGVYSGDGSFPKMENFTYKGILLNKGQNRGGFGFVIFPSSISTLRAGGLARIVPTQPISGLASFSNP